MPFSNRHIVHHNLKEIGIEGQVKLSNVRVAIIGMGGLGCSIAQGLTSLSIGHITLIDDDVISVSNIARQILYQEKDIGFHKCKIAARRLKKHNSEISITSVCKRLTSSNSTSLLKGNDIIIDGTDNIVSRIIIDTYCDKNHIPFVYGGVHKFSGHVSVFNYKGGKSMQESFPTIKDLIKEENCTDSGVILPVISMVANLQVLQAFNIILDIQPLLQGSLQVINLKSLSFRKFKL